MSRRDQQERIDRMCDAHASIVMPDGSVGGIDRTQSPFWNNSASTGREYGADKTGEPHIPASPATGDAPLERSVAAATASGVDLTPGGRVISLIDEIAQASRELQKRRSAFEPQYIRLTREEWESVAVHATKKCSTAGASSLMGLPVVIRGSAEDLRRMAAGQVAVEATRDG